MEDGKLKRYILLTCVAVMVLMFGYAYAAQLSGIGGSVWSHRQSVTTTQACIQDGNSNCMGFPAGRGGRRYSVSITSPDDARCCWLGDSSLAFAGFAVTDAAGVGTGPGACFSFKDNGGRWDQIPNYDDFLAHRSAGLRTGLCEIPTSRGGIMGFLPCDANGDCPSGNCDLTPDNELEDALVYLSCENDTGTTNMDFVIEKING